MRSNAASTCRTRAGAWLLAALLAGLAAGCAAPGRAVSARASVELAPLFSDHAVLQQGRPVPVWGSAAAADPITVTFRGQTARTVAGADGRWVVYLKPLAASSDPADPIPVPFRGRTAPTVAGADGRWVVYLKPLSASSDPADLVVAGQSTVTVHDVVVGEVWLCSGQSNMEFTVAGNWSKVDNADAEVAAADYPLVRQLKIERAVATAPAATAKTGGWQPASPKTVGEVP